MGDGALTRKLLCFFKANALWAELSQANDLVATLLGRLVGLSKDDAPAYEAAVAQAAQTVLRDSTDARLEPFAAAASAFDNVRRLLRAMGDASGAPIEPPEQTALLDACMRIPGVLFGGVPGGTVRCSFFKSHVCSFRCRLSGWL